MDARSVLALALTLLTGCGGKVIFEADGSGGGASTTTSDASASAGSAGIDCAKVTFDPDQPTTECGSVNQSEIHGSLADGRSVEELCATDGTNVGCTLLVEGASICTCPQARIDFSAVGPSGLPTCDGWTIDYSDIGNCNDK